MCTARTAVWLYSLLSSTPFLECLLTIPLMGDSCHFACCLSQTACNENADVLLFFDPLKDEIVSAIEKRVAAWTFLPEGDSALASLACQN